MQRSLCRLVALSLLVAVPAFAQSGTARYRLTFTSTWSAATHPNMFPGNPHYSPLVGGLHNAAVSFWSPGGLASPGIELMAETGAPATLAGEIAAQIPTGHVEQVLDYGSPGMLMVSPAQLSVTFTVRAEHSLLTLVAMLAPSPDWFVGVHALPLIQNGAWIDDLVVPLEVYDAGTDSGVSYGSANSNASPQQPIAVVTTTSGPFAGAPTQVGTFTLERLSSTNLYGCGVNAPFNTVVVAGEARIGQTLQVGTYAGSVTFPFPAATGLALSTAADPAYPCGTQLPGLGLVAGTPGEVLIASVDALVLGPVWNGGLTTFSIPLPVQPALVGQSFHLQGVYVASRIGLTDAVALHVGS